MVAEGPAAPGVVRGGGTGDAYAESDGSRDGDSAEMPSTPPYSSEVCPHDLGGGTCTPLQLWGLTDRRPPGIGGGVVQNDSNMTTTDTRSSRSPRWSIAWPQSGAACHSWLTQRRREGSQQLAVRCTNVWARYAGEHLVESRYAGSRGPLRGLGKARYAGLTRRGHFVMPLRGTSTRYP